MGKPSHVSPFSLALALLCAGGLWACGGESPAPDAGDSPDAGPTVGPTDGGRRDAATDSGVDAGDVVDPDAGVDAGSDAAVDAGDAGCGPPWTPECPPELEPSPPASGVATNVFDGARFLFEGPAAAQSGVAPGTILPTRICLVRGRVLDVRGDPLSGVRVTVLNHPEYGFTFTRADGAFDLAVNAGASLTVNYARQGLLPSQRTVRTRHLDYVDAPDVALIALDPVTTRITARAGVGQIASGSPVQDDDGARQARVFFPADTGAEAHLTDGSTVALGQLTVRATEYTVGDAGPLTMPGTLPPTSAYTYAVELSVDEAMAMDAVEVAFDAPVFVYVDNFLGLPVGGAVPSGFYDRAAGRWVASENGRVIEVVAVEAGLATVDLDGDGAAEDVAALAEVGLDDDERAQIGALYGPGTELWRVPVRHFTPWDLNWPAGPPADATDPDVAEATGDSAQPCGRGGTREGSIIECTSQVLGERVAVPGTPYTLDYRSHRVRGRTAERFLRIPVSGPGGLPASATGIGLEVRVAGQTHRYDFPIQTDREVLFEWDGLDRFGREVEGGALANVAVEWIYRSQYYGVGDEAALAFARVTSNVSVGPSRLTLGLRRVYQKRLEVAPRALGVGLGGWSLDVHHQYDPTARKLYFGSGGTSLGDETERAIETIAGGDDGRYVGGLTVIEVGPDGALYGVGRDNFEAWRLEPTGGPVQWIAGGRSNGACQPGAACGDGGPATQASLTFPVDSAFGPDGSLYLLSPSRLRRVRPDGIIESVAGNGETVHSGDGGPAIDARFTSGQSIAVADDGTIYIASQYRVRRIGPDGIITAFAGTGSFMGAEPGNLAPTVAMTLLGIALDAEGRLLLATTSRRILRVDLDGVVRRVAGTGQLCRRAENCGDGGPALEADVSAGQGLTVGPDGSIYAADNYRVRRIGADGIIETVVGGNDRQPCSRHSEDGTLAANASLCMNIPGQLAVGPDGAIYLQTSVLNGDRRILRVDAPLPGFTDDDIVVAAPSGREVFVFDRVGRHLRTIDARTGATRHTFGYDAAGRLSIITDVDGQVTRVERNPDGTPSAIVGPYGQRTELSVDTNGYLSEVRAPGLAPLGFSYTPQGLLTQMTHRDGNVSTFTYDMWGRLTRDDGPAGDSQDVDNPAPVAWPATSVTVNTALGRAYGYTEGPLSTDRLGTTGGVALERRRTRPDGTVLQWLTGRFGNRRELMVHPWGTEVRVLTEGGPRFGAQSLFARESDIVQPSGLTTRVRQERQVVLQDPDDPLSLVTESYSVDVNGRAHTFAYEAATRTSTVTSPAGRQLVVFRDPAGRPTRVEPPGGLVPMDLGYDADGRLVSMARGPRTLTIGYDAAGRLLDHTDALGRTTTYAYDAADQVTRIDWPDGSATGFGYDASGRLTSATPPGGAAHLLAWTPRDELASYAPPGAGGGDAYLYDLDLALTQHTDGAGRVVERVYEAGTGRRSVLRTPTEDRVYGYDPGTGRLTSIATSSQTVAYGYDGQLLTSLTWSGAVVGTVGHVHDADLDPSALVVDGVSTAFTYDDDGLLLSAGPLSITRDAATGLPTEDRLDQIVTTYAHDAYGAHSGISVATAGGAALYALSVVRDDMGFITQQVETVGATTRTRTYAYDGRRRLETVRDGGTIVESYGYDGRGNRTSGLGGVTGTYSDRDALQAWGGITYAQDGAGRRTTRTEGAASTSYVYDALGLLRRVDLPDGRRVEYVVDGAGRRVGKDVDGQRVRGWLYADALRPVAELDASQAVVSRFVYGEQTYTPAFMVRGGVTYRFVTDLRGSVRLVVDAATGALAQRIDYDAFGRVLQDTNPGFQPFGFAGGLYDPDTGLVRFGARDYDPETGRWTARDPLGFGGGDTNLYAYVGSDPVNYIDPTGRCRGGWDRIASFFANLFEDVADGDAPGDSIKEELGDFGEFEATDTIRRTRDALVCSGCVNAPSLVASSGLRSHKEGRTDADMGRLARETGEKTLELYETVLEPEDKVKDEVKDALFDLIGSILPANLRRGGS